MRSENEIIGDVISYVITVEKLINNFLSEYFCDNENKREQLKTMVLFHERITYDFKKELFSNIIKNQYPSVLISYPDFIKKISTLPEHRNRFAHLDIIRGLDRVMLVNMKKVVWDGSNLEKEIKDVTGDMIIFGRYKNGIIRYIGYGADQIAVIEKDLIYIIHAFTNLKKILKDNTDLPAE